MQNVELNVSRAEQVNPSWHNFLRVHEDHEVTLRQRDANRAFHGACLRRWSEHKRLPPSSVIAPFRRATRSW